MSLKSILKVFLGSYGPLRREIDLKKYEMQPRINCTRRVLRQVRGKALSTVPMTPD